MRPRFEIRRLQTVSTVLALALFIVLTTVIAPSAHAQTFKSLYSFAGPPDGATPYGDVIRDKSGTLYGTTLAGGDGYGTIYKLKKGKDTVLYSFTGSSDGAEPFGGLVMDKKGTLYGTTAFDGSGYGTVFALSSSGTLTVLYSFSGGSDGAEPFSGLTMDSNGNLYGTTLAGGASGDGTVFKVNIKSKKETVLHSFAGGSDGAEPLYGRLLMDKSGNLYGTTVGGGSTSNGTVWKLTPKGKETVLYAFTGTPDGTGVFEQSLAMDTKGNLYGTTEDGGTSGFGTVFEVNLKTKKEKVLYSFTDGADGGFPSSGITRDSKGHLYGACQTGGANQEGVVFEVTGKKETVLHSFDGTDGANPFTSPLLDVSGTLYGVSYQGGTNNYGTVYSIKP